MLLAEALEGGFSASDAEATEVRFYHLFERGVFTPLKEEGRL